MHLSWDCFNPINKCNYCLPIRIVTILFLVCCKWTIEEQVNTRGPVKWPLQHSRHEEVVVTLAFNHIRAERGDQYPVTHGKSKFVDGSQDGLKDIAWTARRIELTLTEMGKWMARGAIQGKRWNESLVQHVLTRLHREPEVDIGRSVVRMRVQAILKWVWRLMSRDQQMNQV